MAEPVLMPQVGQDIKTAKIVDWLKKEDQEVKKGEVIAVVESDKAAFEVEAYVSGVLLKILHPEGEEVEVLTPIAYIGRPGEQMGDTGQKTENNERAAESDTSEFPARAPKSVTEERVAVSPSARRLAQEKGVKLETVKGTGPGGRITKEDILAAAMPVGSGTGEPVTLQDTIVVFSPMRGRIAERLTRSKQTIPHFYLSMDVDMSETMRWRQQFNEAQGTKVTLTDLVVKSVAMGLSDYPKMNAHVEPDRMILKSAIHIGVAVAVEDGLIVPVIAEADKKTLLQISTAAKENVEAARAGRLKPQASGGFTVTNLGMHGVDTFVPVINPPEAAILAIGAVVKRPAVVNEEVVARDMMTMTLACDHRAVDGAYAAQFLVRVKRHLENPTSLEG